MLLAVQPVGEAFLLGFRGLTPPDWLGEFEARFGLGGVLLFDYDVQTRRQGRNITSPDSSARCARSSPRLRRDPWSASTRRADACAD